MPALNAETRTPYPAAPPPKLDLVRTARMFNRGPAMTFDAAAVKANTTSTGDLNMNTRPCTKALLKLFTVGFR